MKKFISEAISLTLTLALILCLAACGSTAAKEELWESATYTKDTTLGNGAKTATVEYQIGEEKITFTIKTDKETLGAALYELGLINDASFFDTLNGIKADWDANSAYWAFYVGDDYAMVGANETVIQGGETYKFVYTTM